MKILFGYQATTQIVDGVFWKDEDGVQQRIMVHDGTVSNRTIGDTFADAIQMMASSHYAMKAKEVAGISSALKYLGKSVDLIDLLPDATIDSDE